MRAAPVSLIFGFSFVLLNLSLCAPAIGAPGETASSVVRLPPLLVESSSGQPWLYSEIDGFEILSRCSQTTTKQLIRAFVAANEGLNQLLPKRFQLRTDEPQLLLLYDAALWPKARQEAIAQMLLARAPLPRGPGLADIETTTVFESAKSQSPEKFNRENTVSDRVFHFDPGGLDDVRNYERGRVEGYVLKRTAPSEQYPQADAPDFFSNIRLSDADIMGTFAIVSGQEVDASFSAITYDAVAQVLNARVPRLPGWFVTGFLSLYSHVRFAADELIATKLNSLETPELERALFPLGDFLQDEGVAARNPSVWVAQAELLVRWGLDPREKHQDAFWRFVDRASVEPENANVFAESFGLSIEDANNDLRRYLLVAKGANLIWSREKQGGRLITLRDATRNEIARIRGEWERLETRYVRQYMREEELAYLTQAQRTVAAAYSRGDHDPRLVATLALLHLEAGERSAAQPLLEEAASSSAVRPRVYFELAKLQYEDALDHTRRNDGRIEGAEAIGIAELLASAANRSPPLLGVYELLTDVWANSSIPPTVAQLDVMERGLTLFSEEPVLHYRAAVLYQKMGDSSRAEVLSKAALNHAPSRLASEIREFREHLEGMAKK